jgi:glyoxylase-like metal-dependent hydrolase (beta-lactamase superfamily II)
MIWSPLRLSGLFALLLAVNLVHAAEPTMRVFVINDHLLCFYDGRPAESAVDHADTNWAATGALNVGVATYVVHRGDRALVYDTFPSAAQAQWVRDYLATSGIHHFVVVNSHWHLDHVGGNAVYADSDRFATLETMKTLVAKKAAIESGAEWGPPVITPLVIPNIAITADTSYFLDDIEVALRPVNIHSEDGLVLYLPADRLLLAGDTLEDTVTFISEPEQIPSQYKNLLAMKRWGIDRILPNHGNPEIIAAGGYRPTLIDATANYLRLMVQRSHDPDYLKGSLEDYVQDSVRNGWVSVWWAYRDAHQTNLARVAAAYKNRPLPEFGKSP